MLWMGVPIVTCPGERFASRHALSHLTNADCADFVATGHDEYVNHAVRLAADPETLCRIRAGQRERVANSHLCNVGRFVEELTTLLMRLTEVV